MTDEQTIDNDITEALEAMSAGLLEGLSEGGHQQVLLAHGLADATGAYIFNPASKKDWKALGQAMGEAIRKPFAALEHRIENYFTAATLTRLKHLLHVAEDMLPNDAYITISVVSIHFDPQANVRAIEKWAANPPKGRADYIELVTDFVPSKIGVDFSVEIAALVVASSAAGVGFGIEWDSQDDIKKIVADFGKFYDALHPDRGDAGDNG